MKPLFAALVLAGPWLCALAEEEPPQLLESESDKINYSVGFRVGDDFKDQDAELDPDLLVRGVQDAVSGAEPLMSPEAMHATLADLQRKMLEQAQAKRQKDLARIKGDGKAFLTENGQKAGVVTLPSGLQYRVIEPGTGRSPGAEDRVEVDYKGTLIDGTEFDSSYQRGEPARFPLHGVIPGWTEALQLMKEGGHWELFLPPELAYGDAGRLAGRTLVFDVRLLKVEPAEASPASAPMAPAGGAKAQQPADKAH